MTCDDLRSDYLAYALGVLEDPEKTELQAHLERGCQDCAAGVREARQVAFGIGAAVEAPDPPPRLRNRILAAAGGVPEPKWHWATAWQAAAAVLLLAVGFTLYQSQRHEADIASLQRELGQSRSDAAALAAFLQAPDTREVTFGLGAPAPPRGRVFYNSSAVLLIASNLPAPPPGKAYEMWIIPKGGKPAPAGLFASNAQGTALHFFGAPGPVLDTDTVAVTLEVAAGVDAPTSQPMIAVPL